MNKVFIIGNLTRNPEAGTTQNDISYCKFTVAVTRRMSKDNQTDFLNVIAWRGLADNCFKFLSKGSKVAVVGSIQIGSYEKDGQKRYTTDIVADEVEFLTYNKDETTQAEKPKTKQAKIEDLPEADDEELPF